MIITKMLAKKQGQTLNGSKMKVENRQTDTTEFITYLTNTKGGSVAEWLRAALKRRKARVQIAVATLSGNSLRQTVHAHRASVHQAAKLVAALLRVAGVTAGLAESNDSLPPGL